MGLALIVVIAGGAFYLLTREGNFSLGPAEGEPDPNDPGFVEGDGVSSGTGGCDDGHSCATRCAKRWCSSFGKCCKEVSCAYCKTGASGIGKQKCTPCSRNYHRVGTYPCRCAPNSGYKPAPRTCKAVTQCPSCGVGKTRAVINCKCACKSAYAHAYTGRVTFNPNSPTYGRENRPINPNSPTLPPRPNPNSPLYMRPSQAYLAQPWHRSISVS